ncbi:MAG: bifunctional folylpolyglutamate synthase/dihydrofolate synthase [Bacteroidia bacterium]|nr:bifunctional folylpolyglutamate synthase/dihydrofolate synthase [Bacteroidia bacterium]
MSYEEVLKFMFAQLPMYQRIGTTAFKKDLTNIRALCSALGDPQKGYYSLIHIAGTNGKGSTAHMLAAVYQSAGYKVGLYTSPHYKDFRERIKINGQMVSKKEVVDFIESNQYDIQEIQPSFFEMSVALAFDSFRRHEVDLAIIETGLGGRLDSTNIIDPLSSTITNIGLDHQNMLGDTLEEIAAEKAGIIKKGTPVIIGKHQPETDPVFLAKAAACDAPIYFAQDLFHAQYIEQNIDSLSVSFRDLSTKEEWQCCLPSGVIYNMDNALTALSTVHVVNQSSQFKVDQDGLINGLENFKSLSNYIGRWHVKSKEPLVILDAAHNEDGIHEVMERVDKTTFPKVHVVFGSVKDKPMEKIFKLLPKAYRYYFAKPDVPRGLDTSTLSQMANEAGLKSRSYVSCTNALRAAKRAASKDDLILVTGSTFVVAEVI